MRFVKLLGAVVVVAIVGFFIVGQLLELHRQPGETIAAKDADGNDVTLAVARKDFKTQIVLPKVLLTAEMTTRFRAVFAFGPVTQGSLHVTYFENFDFGKYDPREKSLRAPAMWLSSIHSPVFVIEGDSLIRSNIDQLEYMQKHTNNPMIQFLPMAGANHFSVLGPSNDVIAQKILKDTGPSMQITLTKQELSDAVAGAR